MVDKQDSSYLTSMCFPRVLLPVDVGVEVAIMSGMRSMGVTGLDKTEGRPDKGVLGVLGPPGDPKSLKCDDTKLSESLSLSIYK